MIDISVPVMFSDGKAVDGASVTRAVMEGESLNVKLEEVGNIVGIGTVGASIVGAMVGTSVVGATVGVCVVGGTVGVCVV